ncbi:MAG: tyrosine-type recombinase/integrase [Alphaproteobacteria bacterium]|nr:tyrosine-type recombinase/integrase [Alphaproteobacteria bacterium]
MIVRLKHVKQVRAKGRTYWYHRITGERLPGDHEERAARVLEINRTLKGTARKVTVGSLSDIIAQYKQAPEFRRLTDRTRHEYAIYLDLLAEKWGPHPVTDIERRHILALRDKYAETPGKANHLIIVLRIVLAFAIDRDYRRDNPARDIKKLKMGPGHSPWPDEAVDAFLSTAPPMMVLAFKLALYTGQREGDVLTMTWHDYDGERIQVVQGKTGTKLSIPVHSALREAMDAQARVSPIILTTKTGRPFTCSGFRHHFVKATKGAGLSGLTFHGLRYTAATRLAEAGCSLKEIASVTGHKSLAMIEKYTSAADQKHLAWAAILRLENAGRTQNGKPR